jgi:hypothetical protein
MSVSPCLTNHHKLRLLSCSDLSGATLDLSAKVLNNGNLRLRNLTLEMPEFFSNLSCSPGFINGDTTLEPQGDVVCTYTHTVTTADIEDGAVDLLVMAKAMSVLGAPVNQTKETAVQPVRRPSLQVTVKHCDTAPTQPGETLHHGYPCSTDMTAGWPCMSLQVHAADDSLKLSTHVCTLSLVLAGASLACVVDVANDGNVGIRDVGVTSPTACTVGLLEPGSSGPCSVTVPATVADFVKSSLDFQVTATGVNRVDDTAVTAVKDHSQDLMQSRAITVTPQATPPTLPKAGGWQSRSVTATSCASAGRIGQWLH